MKTPIQFCTSVLLVLGLMQLHTSAFANDELPEPSVNPQQENVEWLDQYLADEMGYDKDQIKQFKQTVVSMPKKQMLQMLEKIKFSRNFRLEQRVLSLSVNERNVDAFRSGSSAGRAAAVYGPAPNQSVRRYSYSPWNNRVFNGWFGGGWWY